MQYKFFLTGRSGTREVFPSNDRTLEFSFSKDSSRSDFTRELEGTIILNGADFEWIYRQELLIYRCDLIKIEIHKKCDGVWDTDWFEGDISLNSGEWSLDKCKVELSIKKYDRYQCFDDNSDEDVNVFQNVYIRRTIYPKEGNIERQSFYQYVGPGQMFDRFPGEPDPGSKGWDVLEYHYRTFSPEQQDLSGSYSITWVRETKTSVTPLLGWIQIAYNLYARQPILYDVKNDPYNPSSPHDYGYTYKVMDGAIDNGLLLYDVFKMFIDRICPGLTIESDFFQWNPENPTSINYVTGEESKVRNLVLFQKSDIKRPFDTGNASIAQISFSKLLEDICNIFQLEWEITEEDKFKIEHVSYKNRILALDTTVGENAVLNLGNRTYTYDNDDIPKRELFSWMDDTSYGDFKAAPIIYTNSCAGNGDNKENVYAIKNITTDVMYCLSNSASDSKLVSDDGFVLVACNDDFAILKEDTLRGGNKVNNTVAWSQLHRDYWRYNRPLLNFQMNNSDTLAITVRPMKLQENVRFRLCCASDFDTDNLIKTALGDNGILKSASLNLYKGILEMSVLFPAEGKLTENEPPVAHDDAAVTYANIPVVIDVLANDTDDGIIVPSTLALVGGAYGGTAAVTPDWKILFTPTTDYQGTGSCYYQVKDNYGVVSNRASVVITVIGGTPLPVANGTSFIIAKNLELSRWGGALIVNDTAPTPITVVEESKATDQGGTVIINMSGGFSYVPAADFIGEDTFEYTIKDNFNNQDTGTITVTVFEPETVYVEFERTGDIYPQPIIEDCGQGSSVVGQIEKATFRIKTYSDAEKTIPLDVEGYNLVVNIKQKSTYYNPLTVNEYIYSANISSGSDYLYGKDITVYLWYNGYGCGSGSAYPQGTQYEIELTLEPGDGYEI